MLTAARLTELVRHYRAARGSYGAPGDGCMHILFDGNHGVSSVQFCEELAMSRRDWSGARICRLLMLASATQRSRAIINA